MNAEPDADAAFPGVFGAVALPQLWLGCPVRCAGLRVVVLVAGVLLAGVGDGCIGDAMGIAPTAPTWPAAIACVDTVTDNALITCIADDNAIHPRTSS